MTTTVKAIEAARPRDKGYKLSDGNGLYLFITPTGARSWRANFTQDGKQRTRTYGLYPAMSLANARRQHADVRASEADDKVATAKKTPTFETAAKAWLKKKIPELSNPKHQIQVANTLERFVYPMIGKDRLDEIPRKRLVEVVHAAQSGGKGELVETAHRVAGRITAVFDYALDTGVIEQHPAAKLTRVLIARSTKKPMASIPPAETGQLLRAIDTYDEPITRLGLQFMAHTFVRVGELRGFRWSELRENGAIWVIPEERMKQGIVHVVPLSTQARAILKQLNLLTGESELVLESPMRPKHPLSENTFLFALYRLGYRGKMTAHGFRALASTVLNEQSGFPHDVIERQLSHKETDAVRAAYNRAQYLDQRRELMQWFGDWLQAQRLVAGPAHATA